MQNTGWLKLHRNILEWGWWSDLPTRTVFITMLLMANRQDREWLGVVVKEGSFITSREHLAQQSGVSVQQVRRAIDNLVSTGEITKQTTSRNTLITLLNWHEYQDKQPTNNQQTTNKQPQLKKERKKEVIDIYSPHVEKSLLDDYYKMRVQSKSKMTDKAKELLVAKIDKLHGEGYDCNKLLEEAILKNWKSIYPKQENKNNGTKTGYSNTKQSKTEAVIDVLAAIDRGEI